MEARIKKDRDLPRISIIGKIKIGQKNEAGLPESLDYFVADGQYADMFREAFPESQGKPTKIEIFFPSSSIDDVCRERFENRDGAKLFAYGDGEEFMVWTEGKKDPKTGLFGVYKKFTIKEHPDLKDRIAQKNGKDWDHVLQMHFFISRIRGVFGVWELNTKGDASSIPQITSVFDSVLGTAGRVEQIPFDLMVKKVKSQKPTSKSLFPVVSLICNLSHPSLEKVRLFFEHDVQIRGLLTEDRVAEIENRAQLGDGKPPVVPTESVAEIGAGIQTELV